MKTQALLRQEAHEGLAEGIRILVASMGPRQRVKVSGLLVQASQEHHGKAQKALIRLALYVRPS